MSPQPAAPVAAGDVVGRLRQIADSRARERGGDLVHEELLPARTATYARLSPRLPESLGAALRSRGIEGLFTHQVAAIEHARRREHVVVTTPTASGKSLAFNLPVLEGLLSHRGRHALYLYPTKALMADQFRGLQDLIASLPVAPSDRPRVAILSGDVRNETRQQLRRDPPDILLANPDILHFELLRQHQRWGSFLAGLDFVVLDELHAYRGVFGSHVGLLMRRLRRLAGLAGAQPTFIAASATIANPDELAEQLVGLPFRSLRADGAAAGARRFLFWRPPLRGDRDPSSNQHRSATQEAVKLFVELLWLGRTTILFGRSRTAVERMFSEALKMLGAGWADRISAYKSGYLPEERARIEAALREGRLQGVVSTNALELGIDVGRLDAAILAGYPGTVMSTWQQAGRVGRRDSQEALVVLVGADDALDQYYLEHPAAFFGQPSERAVINPQNPTMLLGHLLCAAAEQPLRLDELELFPGGADTLVQRLVRERLLTAEAPHRLTDVNTSPHHQVSIRGVSRNAYTIVHGDRTIGQIEPPHLQREAHPGAVYLHNGQAFRVEVHDPAAGTVRVHPVDGRSQTTPVSEITATAQGEPLATRTVSVGKAGVRVAVGLSRLMASEQVTAYRETETGWDSGTVHPLESPLVHTLDTIGLWMDWPSLPASALESLHAAEHALVNVLPLRLLSDRRDIGSTSTVDRAGGRLTLYDRYEGGVGLAEHAYGILEELITAATDLLGGCRCTEGCPACVHIPGCTEANKGLDKAGALALLLGQPWHGPVALRVRAPVQAPLENDRARYPELDQAERLRRIAEEELRDRLASRRFQTGDRVALPGYGPVIIREIQGERALVQYEGYVGRSWEALSALRRIGK